MPASTSERQRHAYTPFTDRVDTIGALLPVERITCGHVSPDPETERTIARLRADEGYPQDMAGCGHTGRWTAMYRCVDCGRFFHRACLERHLDERHSTSPRA